MKYKLKTVSKKRINEEHQTLLFTFEDEDGELFEVEGGIQDGDTYYDNSPLITDTNDFGRYVEKRDIKNIHADLYNVIFDYLTQEKDFPTE